MEIKTKRDLRYIEQALEETKARLANEIAEEFRTYGTQCPTELRPLTNDEDVWAYQHFNDEQCRLVETPEGVQIEWGDEEDMSDSLMTGWLFDLLYIAEHMFNQHQTDDNDLAAEWTVADAFLQRSRKLLIDFIERRMEGKRVRYLPVYKKWSMDDDNFDRFCGLTTNGDFQWRLLHVNGHVFVEWYDREDREDCDVDDLNDIYLEELIWIAENV